MSDTRKNQFRVKKKISKFIFTKYDKAEGAHVTADMKQIFPTESCKQQHRAIAILFVHIERQSGRPTDQPQESTLKH